MNFIFGASCVVVIFFLFRIYYAFEFLDYFVETSPDGSDEGCIKIMSIGATEDQTKFNNNSILMTEWRVVGYKPGEDRPGSMYVASGFQQNNPTSNKSSSKLKGTEDFVANNLKIEKLPIVDYPDGVDFHPHGIYIRKEDNTLYVVNHAFEKGGERIDVFKIITDGEGDDDNDDDIPIRLDYQYSITSSWMKKELNGVINSIVVVEENKFYITQYLPKYEDTFSPLLKYLILGSCDTRVFYCEYALSSKPNLDCRKVADEFLGANGITHNADYSKIFVASWKSITVFDRDSMTNNLSGKNTIPIPNFVDNIKFDDITGNVYGGTIHNLWPLLKYPYPKESNEHIGGVLELYQDYDDENDNNIASWKTRQVVTTSKLNIISNGIKMNNNYYVIGAGGFGYEGILVCPVAEKNSDDTTPVLVQQSEL